MTMPRLASSRWWYIMPIVFVTYSLAYLDRANYVRESEINQKGKARKLWDIEEGKGI